MKKNNKRPIFLTGNARLSKLKAKQKINRRFFLIRAASIIGFFFLFSLYFWIGSFFCFCIFLLFIFIFHFLEYIAHRFVLHSKAPHFKRLNRMHMFHHGLSNPKEYEISEKNNVATILMGPFPLFMTIIGIGGPVSLIAGLSFWRLDIFFAVVSAFVCYVGIYEGMHFIVHLPKSNHRLYKIFIAPIRLHHEKHHEALGDKGAYGISSPLFDYIFNTNCDRDKALWDKSESLNQ